MTSNVINRPNGLVGVPKGSSPVWHIGEDVKCPSCGSGVSVQWFQDGSPVTVSCSKESCFPAVVEMIRGVNGFIGQRDPRAADVEHLECNDCGGPVFIRWFHEKSPRKDKLCGYTCDDQGCWPVALAGEQ